jgi:hypothetical protein
MSELNLTQHAEKRSQQRAIPLPMLDILYLYGEEVPQKGGSHLLRLNRRSIKTIRRDLKSVLDHLDSLASTYAIEGDDGAMITVGHRY